MQVGDLVRYYDPDSGDAAIGIVTSMERRYAGVLWSTGYDEVPLENLEVVCR